MNYTETLRNYFENHKGEIFDSAFERDRLFPMIETSTYGRLILRLEKDDILTYISKGVYHINDGNEYIEDEIINYYISNYAGMYIGKSLFDKLGLIKSDNNQVYILSKKVKNNKHVGNIYIEKSNITAFMDFEIKIISMLEIYEHLKDDGSVDTKKLIEVAPYLIRGYRDDSFKDIIENRKYYHSTILKYKQSLDAASVKNNVIRIFEECDKHE